MSPKVETLAQSMAAVGAGYDEQRALVNEQISGLGATYGAQRDALEGTRVKAFNTINDQAIGRGASFSGIPLGEQADYLSDKFLPGMVALGDQENQERMQYRQNIAQLNTQQNAAALGRIDQQQQALNQWNLTQAQLEAQRRENELNRQFEASQNAANRALSASQSAGSAGPSLAESYASRLAEAATVKGGYVSSSKWKALRSEFVASGYGTAQDFSSRFNAFVEPGQWKTYR